MSAALLGARGGGLGLPRRAEVGALDLLRLEDLEHVALLHVVEALEEDAALEALLDLADVVLEALQLGDRRLVDNRAFAHDAHLRVPLDDAARHVRAGNRPEPRDAEELAYLGLAERLLGRDRCEHPDERLLDFLGQPVDDAVGADLDLLAIGQQLGLGVRPHVEADDERVRRRRQVDVALGDAADTLVDDAHADLRVLDLAQLGNGGLEGAVDVALEDEVEVLDAAGLHLGEELLEGDTRARRRQLLAAQPLAAALRELARMTLVLDDPPELTGGRWMVEAEDLDGVAGARLLQLFATEVIQRAYPAPGVAGDNRVPDLQRPAVDEHRRGRAAADVEPRLDDRP